MNLNGFSVRAVPYISDAYCKECGTLCAEVSNGLMSTALFCPNCETVYELKMVKVSQKKVSEAFLEQCRKETSRQE